MKRHATILAAAAVALVGLTACGTAGDTLYDLRDRIIASAEAGDWIGLASQCSPETRADAIASVAFAKAFDPEGEILKAAAAAVGSPEDFRFTITGDTAVYGTENDKAVRVNGRWWMDCADMSMDLDA